MFNNYPVFSQLCLFCTNTSYFQRVCHMELLCSVHIIFLTLSVPVGSRARKICSNSLLHHLSALRLRLVIESLWACFPIYDMQIVLPHRVVIRILIANRDSIQSRAKFHSLKLFPQITCNEPKSYKPFLTSSHWGTHEGEDKNVKMVYMVPRA